MVVVAPPRLIRSADVADFYGVTRWTIYDGLRNGRRPYIDGYIGRIGNRHCWNLNEIIQMSADTPCQVCGEPGGLIRMCPTHAVEFRSAWDRAEQSREAMCRFVGMCRWVSQRWEHATFVDDLDDLWSEACVACGERAPAEHPLCDNCRDILTTQLDL